MRTDIRSRPEHAAPAGRPRLRNWVAACAAAEAVGMTAAAAAARTGDALGTGTAATTGAALGVIVAGGLVEGLAVGTAQARCLTGAGLALDRRRFVGLTFVVAGLGWAAASAPAVLAGDETGSAPPAAVVALGALALGAAMGAVLGLVQARTFADRSAGTRWAVASTAAWAPAMAVIFAGATMPDASWPAAAVVPLGAGTGLAAGAVLGAVLGALTRPAAGRPA